MPAARPAVATPLALLVLGIATRVPARAQDAPPAAAAPPLVRHTVSIPMRDGATLAADVIAPADGVARPTILVQTPYGREHLRPDAVMDDVAGYAFVVVDVRGRGGSRAARTQPGFGQRRDDGYDTVEWVAAQPWCDGGVGTWGASALGQQQFRTAEAAPPHLVCAVPIVSGFAWRYATFHPGGVLRDEYAAMMDKLGFGTTGPIRAHPLDDALWRLAARAPTPERIDVPVLMIGGWFDLHPDEMAEDFARLVAASAPPVRDAHRLVLGPWTHHVTASYTNDAGELPYRDTSVEVRRETRAWFDRWLRDRPDPLAPRVRWYVLGADRWTTGTAWPPAGGTTTTWWFAPDHALAPSPPPTTGVATLVHDPARPVATRGGANLDPTLPSGPHDQRIGVLDRDDVLAFATPPLTEPLRIAGRVRVPCVVSLDAVDAAAPTSEALDADVHVRLCDVHPDGRAILLGDAARRVSLRASFASRRPVAASTAVTVEVELADLAAELGVGHRLLLAVAGSNTPRFEVSPVPVRITVHLGGPEGSRVLLPTPPR